MAHSLFTRISHSKLLLRSIRQSKAVSALVVFMVHVSIAVMAEGQSSMLLPKLQFKKWSGDINVPDPVALSVDNQGRVFVTQTKRRKIQDLDIRQHREWIPDDVGFGSVSDKRRFLRHALAIGGNQAQQSKHVQDVNQDGMHDWRDLTVISEVIYQLVDNDGDMKADEISTFAEDFKTEVTGIAAGVMAHEGKVYATVAPDLWELQDRNQDGIADQQRSLVHGFGLHIAYAGHDMHGLTMGPDGKIYWSIGDKGISVLTAEGIEHSYPNQGGVMRCNPDGSDFEVFAHGLRNVQEFAFDPYGRIFGVDNDADQPEERERFVYIVDGMDAGWRCNYQYRGSEYNPWTAEELWRVPADPSKAAAYIVPPIQHYIDGPAGFKFNPGTALSKSYQDYFFVTSAPNGFQHAFQVVEDGDSFKMVNSHQFGSGLAIVGLAFGPDGALYGADWDGGYPLDEKGAVIRIDVPQSDRHPSRNEVQQLLAQGFESLTAERLEQLLGHVDQRVRLGAQWQLVRLGESERLVTVAGDTDLAVLPRLHAIWGLGQLERSGVTGIESVLVQLTADENAHVRSQAAKTLGEFRGELEDADSLIPLLGDSNSQVQLHACLALSRKPTSKAVDRLLQFADAIRDSQHYLRHGVVMALSTCATEQELASASDASNATRRLCCVLALRKLSSPAVSQFLSDENPRVQLAAVRAIHDDQSIEAALPALAAQILEPKSMTMPVAVRVVNANLRIGGIQPATRLANFAADSTKPTQQRLFALKALESYLEMPKLDMVDGRRRNHEREATLDAAEVQNALASVLADSDGSLKASALEVAKQLSLKVPQGELEKVILDDKANEEFRIAALELYIKQTDAIVKAASNSASPMLQRRAIELLSRSDESSGADAIRRVVEDPATELSVKQTAIRELGTFKTAAAGQLLLEYAGQLRAQKLDAGLGLEILEGLKAKRDVEFTQLRSAIESLDPLATDSPELSAFAFTLQGGDTQRGKEVFESHLQAQCSRCHRVSKKGSNIGPELSKIGSQRDLAYLRRAILLPSADIDEKYRGKLFLLDSGEAIKGLVQKEDDKIMVIADSQGDLIEIDKDEIIEEAEQKVSPMPPMNEILTPAEVRDLLAYLKSLKGGKK